MTVARAFVAIGSNISPMENVAKAIHLLSHKASVQAISTFYRTEPIGSAGSPPFVNGVILLETELPPQKLKLGLLRDIERELGRKRSSDKYAPRTIDLDLIVYDDKSIRSKELTLPDPEIGERPFLAIPLRELAPDLVLNEPGSAAGKSIQETARHLDSYPMEPLSQFTESIRKEVFRERRTSGTIVSRATG